MKYLLVFVFFLVSLASFADSPNLETVSFVDVNRYMGKWYSIASFPQRFEKDCTGTTAEYSLHPNNKVKVVNTCQLKNLNGETKIANGSAYINDTQTNAKLRVTFFWPFYGDYWILDLGPNYEYAMVGEPSRKYLWFLARTPKIHESTLTHLKSKAAQLGFDLSKLQMILQPEK